MKNTEKNFNSVFDYVEPHGPADDLEVIRDHDHAVALIEAESITPHVNLQGIGSIQLDTFSAIKKIKQNKKDSENGGKKLRFIYSPNMRTVTITPSRL